jgi:hypothetical protein
MRKNILQSVSGGYDSTYLLIKNLENGDSVYPLYVHASCVHPVKQNIELTVIKNMIQKLKPKFDNLHDLAEINIGIDDIGNINSLQPVLWLRPAPCLILIGNILPVSTCLNRGKRITKTMPPYIRR